MPPKLQEIEGVFAGERWRKGEFFIGSIEYNDDLMTIKGDADVDEMHTGARYRFYGKFTTYRNPKTRQDEKQFNFHTFVAARSHDRDGITEYLCRAGKGLGLGRSTAEALWKEHGGDAVRVIRSDHRCLLKYRSITPAKAEAIAENLRSQQATEDATIELTDLLAGRGLPKTTARKAIKLWGNKAAEKIRKDPYSLMGFRGCGFKLCDALWLELGHRPDRLRRQALCAWHAIASSSDGHTWHPAKHVIQSIRQNIGSAKARPVAAIKMALRLGRLSPNHYGALAKRRTDGANGPITEDGKVLWLAEGKRAFAEDDLARLINRAIDEATPRQVTEYDSRQVTWREAIEVCQCRRCGRQLTAPEVYVWNDKPFGPTCIGYISDGTDVEVMPLDEWIDRQPEAVRSQLVDVPRRVDLPSFSLWPDPATIDGIDDHQRAKLADALVSRVAILGGSPGTGKTYATAMLIRALLKSGQVGMQDIAIGAPTGKAAVRITEALQAAGVDIRARTWHSLLGVGMSDNGDGGWSFLHDESNPWPFRVLIGDESSMLDTALMRSVMAARPRGCHVLLVGDVQQLPPVGQGAPLRDMIASQCVGYGELTEIKRNSGGIVEACAAIRDGKPWSEGDNLVIDDSRDQIEAALRHCDEAQANGLDPVWDCQVLVAVNSRSPLSRKVVNERLQEELNSNPKIPGTPFRIGDKIVCLKNGKYPLVDGGDDATADDEGNVYVANGELARVIDIEPKLIYAVLSSPERTIKIPRGKSSEGEASGDDASNAGCAWDLAYGLTCHKLQGSECPVVIVLIDEYPGARMVCDRSWLYTAISRAKALCVLVGKKATADAMCRRVAIGKRKTFLRERMQMLVAERTMETI